MTSFGSTIKDCDPIPRDQIEGSPKQKAATVKGLQLEITRLRQEMGHLHEQMRRLIGSYQNLDAAFQRFQAQRVVELNARLGGGPTERGNHGANDRPRD